MADLNYTFTDAVEMHRKYPKTFARPSLAELHGIEPDSFVKVGVKFDPAVKVTDEIGASYAIWVSKAGQETADRMDGEKFWVRVRTVSGTGVGMIVTAEIDTDMVYTAHHGLRCGDVIKFLGRHALMVMTAQEMADASNAYAGQFMPSREKH